MFLIYQSIEKFEEKIQSTVMGSPLPSLIHSQMDIRYTSLLTISFLDSHMFPDSSLEFCLIREDGLYVLHPVFFQLFESSA